jgi:hypothetical protein
MSRSCGRCESAYLLLSFVHLSARMQTTLFGYRHHQTALLLLSLSS